VPDDFTLFLDGLLETGAKEPKRPILLSIAPNSESGNELWDCPKAQD